MFTGKDYRFSIPWNLFLVTMGTFLLGVGVKAIAIPHGFITGGMSGMGLLIYYFSGTLTPGTWYLIVNIPVFILGWLFISRRFFFYSLYGATALTAAIDLISFTIPITDPVLAVMAGGVVVGAGAGMVLRSLGSNGGTDIIGVILNQKFNMPIGRFFFTFNLVLFGVGFSIRALDTMLYSLAMSFLSAQVMDYCLSMFNQRKMVLVISEKSSEIAPEVLGKLKRGATFLDGQGAYSGRPRKILMTVVHNLQLKRMEEIVFGIDPDAFMIAENTFNVLGKGFSKRKVY
ncbi:MAG: YitT family protein [Desulfobacterales bacterium]|nr:YitT family protein [Desulfobacterales bacterium]